MALTIWHNVHPGDAIRSRAGHLVVDRVTEVPNEQLLVVGHDPATGRERSFYAWPSQVVSRAGRPPVNDS
jgi:hypothetical protein